MALATLPKFSYSFHSIIIVLVSSILKLSVSLTDTLYLTLV